MPREKIMFVQMMTIRAAPEAIPTLRRIAREYVIPQLNQYPGLISAHLIAHIDHQDSAKLIVYWESETAMRNARREINALADNADMPVVPGMTVSEENFLASAI
jgi:heme-degrading monooxygenase HmoA